MSGTPSPRLRGLLGLAGVGVVAGLASGRPELVVLAAPVLVFIAVGLVLAIDPRLTATVELERSRLLEGDQVRTTATLRNDGSTAVEVDLTLLRSRHLVLEPAGGILLRLAAGSAQELALVARPERWGSHAVGPLIVRAGSLRSGDVGSAAWATRDAPRVSA